MAQTDLKRLLQQVAAELRIAADIADQPTEYDRDHRLHLAEEVDGVLEDLVTGALELPAAKPGCWYPDPLLPFWAPDNVRTDAELRAWESDLAKQQEALWLELYNAPVDDPRWLDEEGNPRPAIVIGPFLLIVNSNPNPGHFVRYLCRSEGSGSFCHRMDGTRPNYDRPLPRPEGRDAS